MMRTVRAGRLLVVLATLVAAAAAGACQPQETLTTRTFELKYLRGYQVEPILSPYVYEDREGKPGMMSTTSDAVTVRETEDNLDRIARVLDRYDRPKPSVTLHFQIIEADGPSEAEPSIGILPIETELRRLFRFQSYALVAQTQVSGIEGTSIRQLVSSETHSAAGIPNGFMIQGGVSEVRSGGGTPTVTVDVSLSAMAGGNILETSVTIPVGHSVVLGTANAPAYEGALILVVRAEVMETGIVDDSASTD